MENHTLTLLSTEIAKLLYTESVDVDVPIGDLGIDSMRVVELILICGQLYDTQIEIEDLEIDQFTSLRQLDEQFIAMAQRSKQGQAMAPAGE